MTRRKHGKIKFEYDFQAKNAIFKLSIHLIVALIFLCN